MLAPFRVTVFVVFVNETAAPPQVVDGASAIDPDDVVAMLRLAGSVSVKLDCVSAKPLDLGSVIVSIEPTFSLTLAGANASVTVGADGVTANAVGHAPAAAPAAAGVAAALLMEPVELTDSAAVSMALASSVTVRVSEPAPVGVTVTWAALAPD